MLKLVKVFPVEIGKEGFPFKNSRSLNESFCSKIKNPVQFIIVALMFKIIMNPFFASNSS